MREKQDLADIGEYYVKVTRKNPVSEEHIPLTELLRAAPVPPAEQALDQPDLAPLIERIAAIEERSANPPLPVAQPAPPQIDMGSVEAVVAQMIREAIEALPPQPPPVQPEPPPQTPFPSADMPAFLHRMAEERGALPPPPASGPDIGDVIDAVNEIETRVLNRLDELARRLDRLESRLDMAPEPFTPVDTSDSVKVLEEYLRAIDARATHADQVAASLANRQAEIEQKLASQERQPAQPIPEPLREPVDQKAAAMVRIREAAEARRNLLIGPSADSRDVRHRLVELALNAAHGHTHSIEMLRRLADVQGIEWDGLRKALVEQHDVATAVVVQTAAAESWAAIRLSWAADTDVDRIVHDALGQIERAGG